MPEPQKIWNFQESRQDVLARVPAAAGELIVDASVEALMDRAVEILAAESRAVAAAIRNAYAQSAAFETPTELAAFQQLYLRELPQRAVELTKALTGQRFANLMIDEQDRVNRRR